MANTPTQTLEISTDFREIKLPARTPTYSDIVNHGPVITPQGHIKLYSDKQWEEFTEECAEALKPQYIKVRRFSGSGDQGIDIAGYKTDQPNAPWDNYQCKHYASVLSVTDILLELGKLCHYTFIGAYTIPENYYFVTPQGISTSLSKILRNNHATLKRELINNWKKYCEKKITSKQKIILTGDFKQYVEAFDFSIIKDKTVLEMLAIHRNGASYYHSRRFGGLPTRPESDKPPESIAAIEAVYIQKLLNAYAEFLQKESCNVDDVEEHDKLKRHLRDARIQFYCAESLQKFSRDYLDIGEFERLQNNIFTAIINIIDAEHQHGFSRVVNAVQTAFSVQIDSHPLKERLESADRAGICHQLANNNKLSWANSDQQD